jgi:WD40 repeat protein
MVKKASNERITAAGLMEQIHNYEDSYVYYNSCCNGEEESENGTSYQGSIFGEDASAIEDSQNSTKAWIDDGAANITVPTSSEGLDEVPIQRQALPLRSLDGKNEIGLETVFQHSDAALERAIVDTQAPQLLLDYGLDIHADGFEIEDTLLRAAKSGHEEVVRLLLDNGADVNAANAAGETALHWAAKRGHDEVARLLVDSGAFLDTKDRDGQTAIYRAAEEGHQKVVQLLTEKGAVLPSWMQQLYSFKQFQIFKDNWNYARFINFSLPDFEHYGQTQQQVTYTIQLSGDYLVSAGRDEKIRIWNIKTGTLVRGPLEGHTTSVLCLKFDKSEKEDVIISASSDGSFIIWEFSTGELKKRVNRAHESSILNLCFDENYLVTCSKDKLIKVWNRKRLLFRDAANTSDENESGYRPPYSVIRTLAGHTAGINTIQLDKSEIISGSGDRTIKVWSLETGECLKTIQGHTKGIACLQLDGRRIISGSNDLAVRIFDRATGEEECCLIGHTDLVRCLQVSFADNRIVSGSYDGTIVVWQQDASGNWVAQHQLCQFNALLEAFKSAGWQQAIGPGQLLRDNNRNRILSVQFDSRFLICSADDGRIIGWDFSNGDDMEAEVSHSHSECKDL